MSQLEKLFTENSLDSDVILQKVIELGTDFLSGEWKKTEKKEVKVTKIIGGQSNHIFHVTSSSSATPFLLRIHRQGPSHVFIDTVNFALFSERGIGPKLLGFFDGGRIEEFIESKTFSAESVLDPEVSKRIGSAFPRYHLMNVPLSKNRRCFQVMREILKEYQDPGGGDFPLLPTRVSFSDHPESISLEEIHREIDEMEKWSREIYENTVVFCHNDLTGANILKLDSNKELMFIDWEFASYNCRGFDLAMFLSETAIARGLLTAQINEELTENHPNLYGFCEAYVDSDNTLKSRTPSDRSTEISNLMKECEFFWPITHLFWACFLMKLSLIKYNGPVDLSVRGRDRLTVYFHLKPRSKKIYEEFKG